MTNFQDSDLVDQGSNIQFYVYYTAIPFFGPSADDMTNAMNTVSDLTVQSVSKDLINRVGSMTQEEWNIVANVQDAGVTAGQIRSDIFNAMNALLQTYQSSSWNLTVSPIQSSTPQTAIPQGAAGSNENWMCTNLGIGCQSGGIFSNLGLPSGTSIQLTLALVAVIVVAILWLFKGPKV